MRYPCTIFNALGEVIKVVPAKGRPIKTVTASSTGAMLRRFGTAPKRNWNHILDIIPKVKREDKKSEKRARKTRRNSKKT